MLKSGLLLAVGGFLSKLLSLLRLAVIARIVSTEDFGIVSTFLITVALIEMVSAFSLDRMVVQDREGGSNRFIAAMHTLQLGRGVIGMIALLLISHPYAGFLGTPEVVWAYQVLAISPIMRGLAHFDLYRVQRDMKFSPFVIWNLSCEGAALLSVGVFWLFLDDWRLGLWVVVLHQVAICVTSHMIATRPYRLGWDREILMRALRFGLPLLINAALLFAVINGDRLIVSNLLGLEALAVFSVSFLLTMVPTSILGRAHQFTFLPLLARVQDDPVQFRETAHLALESLIALAMAIALFFYIFGLDAVLILFGPKYADAGTLIVWMGVMHALRVARTGPTTVALAQANTRHSLIANLVRALAVPVAFVVLSKSGTMLMVIWLASLAEIAAFAASLYMLQNEPGAPRVREMTVALSAFAIVLAAILLNVSLFPPSNQLFGSFHFTQVGLVIMTVAAILSMPAFRKWALSYFDRR